MDHVHKLTQAYSQTPWRRQLQVIGLFLAALVVIALIAGVYLNVTARATTVGRQIQHNHVEIVRLQREIKDQQAQLALLTSAVEMEKRAIEMGFRPATSEEILYLAVPEYEGRAQVVLAPETRAFAPAPKTLSPAFTQSLFDWLKDQFSLPPLTFEDEMP